MAVSCVANTTDECGASILKLKVSIKRKCSGKAAIDWSKTKDMMNTNVRTLPFKA
jgi:hypothetical protein